MIEARSLAPGGVLFMLPGAGVEFRGMGRHLLGREPAFDEALDSCEAAAAPWFERPLRDFLRGDAQSGGPGYRPAALAAFCIAVGAALGRRGVTADILLGCSIGEIAALAMSGAVSHGDAFRFVAEQAEALSRHGARGTLLFGLGDPDLEELVSEWEDAELAGVYAPGLVLLAVIDRHLAPIARRLEKCGAVMQVLPLSIAVHSRWIEPARAQIRAAAERVAWRNSGPAVFSSATGRLVEPGPEHLWRVARSPIGFCNALVGIGPHAVRLAVDLGPSASLATAARRASGGGFACMSAAVAGSVQPAALDRIAAAAALHGI